MELQQVKIDRSPLSSNRVRVSGIVTYDQRHLAPEEYWFDLDERYGADLLNSGDAWLVNLLPLATSQSEPLRLSLPVDPVLLQNLRRVARIWQCWDPRKLAVPIEAPTQQSGESSGSGTVAFFTGGVDSFFSILRHAAPSAGVRITELLYIWGYDIQLHQAEAFQRRLDRLARAAGQLGLPLMDVATNSRALRWGEDFMFAHGCGLAGIAHALSRRYRQAIIASTGGYRDLDPGGSHVLTDPLLSSSRVRILHDGAEYSRLEKTAHIAAVPLVQQTLHVCQWYGDRNCGECRKCYLTALTFDLFGHRPSIETFPQRKGPPPDFTSKKQPAESEKLTSLDWAELHGAARLQQREDIVREAERYFRQQRLAARLLPIIRWLNRHPGGVRAVKWASHNTIIRAAFRQLSNMEVWEPGELGQLLARCRSAAAPTMTAGELASPAEVLEEEQVLVG